MRHLFITVNLFLANIIIGKLILHHMHGGSEIPYSVYLSIQNIVQISLFWIIINYKLDDRMLTPKQMCLIDTV